jgi:Outer membrane protein beta-barrel domain
MKKFLSMVTILFFTTAAIAQKDSTTTKTQTTTPAPPPPAPVKKEKDWTGLNGRANDHFMINFAYDNWAGKPDTIRTKGFCRSFGFYFMLDFPFKTDPHFSVGAGLGVSSSNIYFDKQYVNVISLSGTLPFTDQSSAEHYKKSKLVNTYVELPIELRYAVDPEHTNNTWKFALGIRPGLMLSAYTKVKDLQNNAGQLENAYIQKQSDKHYFNGSRLATTARISYGVFGIFAMYQPTPLIKSGQGPTLNPFSIGLVISGL